MVVVLVAIVLVLKVALRHGLVWYDTLCRDMESYETV